MPTLSKSELVDHLMGLRGAKFTTIVAETDPRMRKTGNPYVGATKISRVNGVVNWIYRTLSTTSVVVKTNLWIIRERSNILSQNQESGELGSSTIAVMSLHWWSIRVSITLNSRWSVLLGMSIV